MAVDPITGLEDFTLKRGDVSEQFKSTIEKKIEEGAERLRAGSKRSIYDVAGGRRFNISYKDQFGDRVYNESKTIQEIEEIVHPKGYTHYSAGQRDEIANQYNAYVKELEAQATPQLTIEQAREQYKQSGEGKLYGQTTESLIREDELLGEIGKVRESAETELALELKRRMEGIQEQEGAVRGQIGEAYSKRGLLRSTFSREGIQESALREQEKIGTERIGTVSQIQQLRNAEQKLVTDLDAQRERLLLIRDINDIMEIEKQRNMLVEANLKNDYMKALAGAQIDSTKKQAMMGTIMNVASTAAMIYAFCWVARAVYGPDNIKWYFSRIYILDHGPKWFRNLYGKYGERVAKVVEKNRILKIILRPLFEYFSFRGRKSCQL